MIEGGHGHAGLFHPLAVLPGDAIVLPDEAHGGDAAQADDDLGPDEGHLVAEIADAGILLGVQGVTVVGGTALDDVGDVHVFLPVQVDELQHVVQQLARPAHKGLALQVLVLPGALAHEQDLRVPAAHAEHHVMPSIRQGAPLTAHAGLLQGVPVHPSHFPGPFLSCFCSSIPHRGRGEKPRREDRNIVEPAASL